ncbi:MAG: OmpA family protein [Syntrophaceae bacterium]|nr:OmpA family protein [Syntrophaceae bacterium]
MKKIVMLLVIMMLMAVFTAVQAAEVRAGGLPALSADDSKEESTVNLSREGEVRAGGFPAMEKYDCIDDCPCPPFCPPPPPPPPPPIEEKVCPPCPECPKPEPPPPVVVAPKPAIIEKGRQTLDVKFDFDKATIKAGYYKDIDDLIEVMKDYPDLQIVVEGHTDSVGSAAYNRKLSQERANAVKKYMVENGVNASRITARGYGEEEPIASNSTEQGRAKNRRVEAVVEYLIER